MPVAEDGQVVVRKIMKVNATFDHRFIDGYHAAVMSRTLRKWLENPEENYGPNPGASEAREQVSQGWSRACVGPAPFARFGSCARAQTSDASGAELRAGANFRTPPGRGRDTFPQA
jgi:hypothetical protein